MVEMEIVSHDEEIQNRLNDVLISYGNHWDEEITIFCNHLESKKQETERISSLEEQIEAARSNTENIPEQLRGRDNYDKLKGIYHTLKAREALYETHLKCNLHYESLDVYKFSFLNTDSTATSWIRFKHDRAKNRWTVLETQPADAIPETIIQKFDELQDTQGLLCYFRSRI